MPMGDQYVNFADCVRQNPQARDPDAYCGSIKARTENKAVRGHLVDIGGKPASSPEHAHKHRKGTRLTNAVAAASHLNQAVRLALKAVAHDPNRERVFPTKECSDGQHNHEKGMRCHDEKQEHTKFQKAHDPVKEEGDKKLKEADGVAADGAQDDQAFAVAYGVDNYDELVKSSLTKSYSPIFKAARQIIHNIMTERSFR